MAIVINGSGTVTGLAVGGLPDDTVDEGSLANSINTSIGAKLPLAGGTMSGNVRFPDNATLQFGAATPDLTINHDGAHSNIVDSGTGDLRIRADNLRLSRSSDAELYLYATTDAGVQIYHNGSEKIKTTATGVAVTGKITGALGSVLQTATGTKTGEHDMNSSTLTDIPSMNVTLTASAQSSKFLVMVAMSGVGKHSGCNGVVFNLQRTIAGVGTTHRLIHGKSSDDATTANKFGWSVASMLLDVPNNTAQITWTVQMARSNSSGYARINANHGTNTVFSSITVQEIGA